MLKRVVMLDGLLCLLMACSSRGELGPQENNLAQTINSGPLARKLADEFSGHFERARGLSYGDLKARYEHDYASGPSFAVTGAAHYDEFVSAFSLSTAAQKTLSTLGFVVVPALSVGDEGRGPADLYYRVFAADLPLFVSADSILHAWHRTFDKLLESTEDGDLSANLGQLLDKTMAQLDATRAADKDALFYLGVAKTLLDGSDPPAPVKRDVAQYLSLIDAHQLVRVRFMGLPTVIDFSQFIPRGHYTNRETLKKYFMALMWLGRTDLVLYDPAPGAEARPREEAAARALVAAMVRGGAMSLFQRMDRFYRMFVGKTNALNPEQLLALCADAALVGCVGSPEALQEIYAKQPAPEYSSRVFAGAVPPISLRFFPQRFAYDAWVTSQTTTPRLEPALPGGRAMAMPEDVAFALGSDRALTYFAADVERPYRENLPAALEAARQTMAAIKPSELEDTAFNHWLEALMALSRPGLEVSLPQVMRSAAWHDRKLEAVLASWTELRHDTILVAEQSTGGIGCQYPQGYVEPVPQLYRALAQAAERLAALYADKAYTYDNVTGCMDHWRQTLERLAVIAEAQLASQPMSAEQLAFLNETVDLHGPAYGGGRVYDGWYPQLFWTPSWQVADGSGDSVDVMQVHPSGLSEPVVADVHTDADTGQALEVATSNPGLMIVAIDNEGDISLYGGPVSSYYSLHVALSERMTDDQWRARIAAGNLPTRPEFSKAYWVE